MRALHLFAGAGGSVLAGRLLGWTSVGAVEIDPFCCAVLESQGEVVLGRDICSFDATGLGVDVVVGGFPCQDVSVAGKRAGSGDGTRSGLWRHMLRVWDECGAPWLFAENVRGLLSSDGGRDYAAILEALASRGSRSTSTPVGSAAHHHRQRARPHPAVEGSGEWLGAAAGGSSVPLPDVPDGGGSMKPCPVCGEDPKPEVDGFTWRWTCRACVISATPAAWAALPRVAPNAEALVDALVSAACARRYCEDGDTQDVMRARADLLRACVVDAAGVAALRVQRDALEAWKVDALEHGRKAEDDRDNAERSLAAKDRALTHALDQRDEARVQRDAAVARMAAVKNPAPFPSERFVATVIAMMPEWFNDADATDSFRALTKALRDAAADLPRDTPDVVIERATGVPEAELLASNHRTVYPTCQHVEDLEECGAVTNRKDVTGAYNLCSRHGGVAHAYIDRPAAPPVAEDADALLDAFEKAAWACGRMRNAAVGPDATSDAIKAAVRARMRPPIPQGPFDVDAFADRVALTSGFDRAALKRALIDAAMYLDPTLRPNITMRPPITAEALWKCALDGGSPLMKNHMSYAMCEELAAALAALGGGK